MKIIQLERFFLSAIAICTAISRFCGVFPNTVRLWLRPQYPYFDRNSLKYQGSQCSCDLKLLDCYCHNSCITKAASTAVLCMVHDHDLRAEDNYSLHFRYLAFRSWSLLFLRAHSFVYSHSMIDMRNIFNQSTLMSCLRKKS